MLFITSNLLTVKDQISGKTWVANENDDRLDIAAS